MTRSIVKQSVIRSRRNNELEFIDEQREERKKDPKTEVNQQMEELSKVPDDELFC